MSKADYSKPVIVRDCQRCDFRIPTGEKHSPANFVELVKFKGGDLFVAGGVEGKTKGKQITTRDRVKLIEFLIEDLNTDKLESDDLLAIGIIADKKFKELRKREGFE